MGRINRIMLEVWAKKESLKRRALWFLGDDSGMSEIVQVALIAGLVVIVAVGVFTQLTPSIRTAVTSIGSTITANAGGSGFSY